MRRGGHGLHLRKVDLEDVVVARPGVCDDLPEVCGAPLSREEPARHGIGREHARGNAKLRAHVRDSGPAWDVQRRDARPCVFEYPAHVPLGAEFLQDCQYHVLRACAAAETALQDDRAHFRRWDVERAAGHGDGDVDSARADGDLADAAAGRRVGVGAKERRPGTAKSLQMKLVADSVAGLGIDDAELLGHGREEVVVVGVLKADLDRVVIDVRNGQLVLHALQPHRLELKVGHGAGCVLCKRLVYADSDFGIATGIPLHEMREENLLHYVHCFFVHMLVFYHISAKPARERRPAAGFAHLNI